jgi:hypothetical protein
MIKDLQMKSSRQKYRDTVRIEVVSPERVTRNERGLVTNLPAGRQGARTNVEQ